MASNIPTTQLPIFNLESKHADIVAFRGDDFHYSWLVGKNQLLTVEYIPDNYPSLNVVITDRTVEQMKATLEEIGFEIQEV